MINLELPMDLGTGITLVDFINEVFPAMELDSLEGGLPNPFFEFFNNVETYIWKNIISYEMIYISCGKYILIFI